MVESIVIKSIKRKDKRTRMAALYRQFFGNPRHQAAIAALGLEQLVTGRPRLVRDTILGTKTGGPPTL